jgi:hypothetical protein
MPRAAKRKAAVNRRPDDAELRRNLGAPPAIAEKRRCPKPSSAAALRAFGAFGAFGARIVPSRVRATL